MHAMAVRDDADIVIGKVVGYGPGKLIPKTLFVENRSGIRLGDWASILWLLSPHKLFRRSMLDEHGIRFPEGRRRLEDHLFVMHAYFHARSISVLADYPCYHWMVRERESTRRCGRSTPRSTTPTSARCSTSSTSTPSRASCATASTRAGCAASCSGARAGRRS